MNTDGGSFPSIFDEFIKNLAVSYPNETIEEIIEAHNKLFDKVDVLEKENKDLKASLKKYKSYLRRLEARIDVLDGSLQTSNDFLFKALSKPNIQRKSNIKLLNNI